ncbi:MAG: hypothetical protein DME19_19690 [Verrucomicrobia bacterium]|nr:MAG: hypothetical protein DME19_19690 [Verrucomicrobiota bacterium]
MNLTSVGTSRCDVPARESAGGIVAPLNAARTAQRAVPTGFIGPNTRCKTAEALHEPGRRLQSGTGFQPVSPEQARCLCDFLRFMEREQLLPL